LGGGVAPPWSGPTDGAVDWSNWKEGPRMARDAAFDFDSVDTVDLPRGSE